MFYSQVLLSRKGTLGRAWLAAHYDKKLSKAQVRRALCLAAAGRSRRRKRAARVCVRSCAARAPPHPAARTAAPFLAPRLPRRASPRWSPLSPSRRRR
jgi:hypothetical protein